MFQTDCQHTPDSREKRGRTVNTPLRKEGEGYVDGNEKSEREEG